jgi:hypothetical protein
MIQNYNDFIAALLDAGFSGAVGGRDDGVFGLFRYGWGAEEETGIEWHTGDPDTDPWEWRMRVLAERDDIAYSKVFFKKAGYITKEWYPCFLAARRGGRTFGDEYAGGTLSHYAKRIYEAVDGNLRLPLHEIKQYAGFRRDSASKFDAALNELQMKLYLTMCGREQKFSRTGGEYGWHSTVFCTTETFWPPEVFERAAKLTEDGAVRAVAGRVLALNPATDKKKLVKFVKG